MRLVTIIVASALTVLGMASCSTPGTSSRDDGGSETSDADDGNEPLVVVTGSVVAGPFGPPTPEDETGGVEPLGDARLVVLDDSGAEVASVVTDADGSFSFTVPAGRYEISPQPVEGMSRTAESQTIDVPLAEPLTFTYDTGVR